MKTRRTIHPTNGTSTMNHHHPLLPVSWSLRTVTASEGINTASEYRPPSTPVLLAPVPTFVPMTASMMARTKLMITLKSTNIQNSWRRARPPKTAYFFNTSTYQFTPSSLRPVP
jgi:hypothetical protein